MDFGVPGESCECLIWLIFLILILLLISCLCPNICKS